MFTFEEYRPYAKRVCLRVKNQKGEILYDTISSKDEMVNREKVLEAVGLSAKYFVVKFEDQPKLDFDDMNENTIYICVHTGRGYHFCKKVGMSFTSAFYPLTYALEDILKFMLIPYKWIDVKPPQRKKQWRDIKWKSPYRSEESRR